MSIPKEPRQLMINLMYIVLTALLALNVSAEILNAFMTMDESIVESSEIVGRSNEQMLALIHEQADAYTQFDTLRQQAEQVQKISRDFYEFVARLKTELIEKSGGLDENELPKGMKDKDVTTRLLVEEGRGTALEQEIRAVRANLLGLIDSPGPQKELAEKIPLNIKPVPENSDKKSWAAFNFQQMPVAAILPLLSKFQNDVKIAETALLNYFLSKTDAQFMKPDEYEAVVSADKSYVIRGEDLTAEVFLGAYSSTADNISVTINNRSYPVREGKAVFRTRPETLGTKDLDVLIRVANPITGETKSYRKKFTYEVGERSVAVSADKMNVFYTKVDNPVSVSVAGVPSTEVQVSAEGVNLTKTGNGKYIARPDRPGKAKITVSGGGLSPTTFEYFVKPIPTPIPMMGELKGGTISAGRLKVYDRIRAVLENFDFNAKCVITSYEVTRLPKNDDPQFSENEGGRFTERTRRIINRAKRGDKFYFENIRAKCPGDVVTRELNSLIFRIK